MAARRPPPAPPQAEDLDEDDDAGAALALERGLRRSAPPLAALGWDPIWAAAEALARAQLSPELLEGPALRPARVSVEHRGRLVVVGPEGPRLAWAPRGSQHDSSDPALALLRPRVGDWVLLPEVPEPRVAAVLPRRTALLRQTPRRKVAVQVVAANLDLVVVVTAWGKELNVRRVERYLAAAEASGAEVLVLVNKIDLAPPGGDPVAALLGPIAAAAPVLALSTRRGDGVEALQARLRPGRTLGLVGSSGVGKSSIINMLIGAPELAVGEVRTDDEKGRHTTTHRELLVLPPIRPGEDSGGVLIDTPGMRELQLWDGTGVERSFDDLAALAEGCRFRGCTHSREQGCALQKAITEGELEPGRLASFRKLMAEVKAKDDAQKRRRDPRKVADERWDHRAWRPTED